MSAPTPTARRAPEPGRPAPRPAATRWILVGLLVAVLALVAAVALLLTGGSEDPVDDPASATDSVTEPPGDTTVPADDATAPTDDPAPSGDDPQGGDDPTPADTVPEVGVGLSEPAAASARDIHVLAERGDLDGLARLALAGDAGFTASFGEEITTPDQLVALWEQLGAEEVLDAIVALVGLPDWYPLEGTDAAGAQVTLHVTPRFLYDPTDASRGALEAGLGAEAVAADLVDGDWYGWRLGIDETGDWRFLVRGD